MTWIEDRFPNLDRVEITSPVDNAYNCVAWAAEDTSAWWTHHLGYHWPDYAPRTAFVVGLIAVFEGMGYEQCDSADLEPSYEKVALYARRDLWTHAARQLDDGSWTSKLGEFQDIWHATPGCLAGLYYGDVYCIMRRPRR